MKNQHVYFFGGGKAEGRSNQRELLGGKGAGLAEMTRIGLPVPAGFTITTEACARYVKSGGKWPPRMEAEVRKALARLEKTCGKKLGDRNDPLLVSVRSGAARSMPGMMETILNLGISDESVLGLSEATGNPRFAWDAYRRFLQMYSTVVVGLNKDVLEDKLSDLKARLGVQSDTEISADGLRELCGDFKQFFREQAGEDFPQEPWKQLVGAINAVFGSWNAEKAVTYRRVEKIFGLTGTGVNVQQMVFGNMGDDCGTGVCFTRDPSTGENVFYGDMLINAQGEDVVAGIRTPLRLIALKQHNAEAYEQLCAVRAMLEIHYGEMQDLEFTVERNKLYMLQCRVGKRTPAAAFKIAVDQATKPLLTRREAGRFVKKGYMPRKYLEPAAKPVITKEQAIDRITAADIERLFYPVISPSVTSSDLEARRLTTGIGAVPGAARGKVAFSAAQAEEMAASGYDVILVRKETSPDDVGGMHAAKGILTKTGGKTSHAAVVARGWGKCCIVGCAALRIDYDTQRMNVNGRTIVQGATLTLDGSEGHVYDGAFELEIPEMPQAYYTLMKWADKRRRLGVRANADSPGDARRAIEMGAEGIGLCRTEHMFFDTQERRLAIQEMIIAEDVEQRVRALDKLLPFQQSDFEGIFEAMAGKPVTIRLIDPPLHEFVPKTREQAEALSDKTGVDVEHIMRRSEELHETNPMLGHRGCRLCITYPEILDMQVRAIILAAAACTRRKIKVLPEIMIPLTIDAREFAILEGRVRELADEILKAEGVRVKYLVGTMIEAPRAALLADQLAETADFFSFGTNDLTQTVMALSRDDAGSFLSEYVDQSKAAIFAADPFETLDLEGVGQLVEMAVKKSRAVKPRHKIGICGEHGGDPQSVKFCHRIGMDYVSCSPFRVPIARLAAAQAVKKTVMKAGAGTRGGAKRVAAKRSGKKPGRKKTAAADKRRRR